MSPEDYVRSSLRLPQPLSPKIPWAWSPRTTTLGVLLVFVTDFTAGGTEVVIILVLNEAG